MKKIIFLFLYFIIPFHIHATNHKDISIIKPNTQDNLQLTIYDKQNNIIETWIQDKNTHIVSLEIGNYKLVETPILNNEPVYYLSNYYDLNIDNETITEMTLYNKTITTPKNLKITSPNIIIGTIIITIGLFITFIGNFNIIKHIIK